MVTPGDSLQLSVGREEAQAESCELPAACCTLTVRVFTRKGRQRGWHRFAEKRVPVEGLDHTAGVLQLLADTYAERFFLRFPAHTLTRGRAPVNSLYMLGFVHPDRDPRYEGFDEVVLRVYRWRKGLEPTQMF